MYGAQVGDVGEVQARPHLPLPTRDEVQALADLPAAVSVAIRAVREIAVAEESLARQGQIGVEISPDAEDAGWEPQSEEDAENRHDHARIETMLVDMEMART